VVATSEVRVWNYWNGGRIEHKRRLGRQEAMGEAQPESAGNGRGSALIKQITSRDSVLMEILKCSIVGISEKVQHEYYFHFLIR
jgi:hypothetical protein